MKKILMIGTILLVSSNAFSWEVGDTAYIHIWRRPSSFWVGHETNYYAKVTIDAINHQNNKAKILVESICESYSGTFGGLADNTYCGNEREKGGYSVGDYKWTSLYNLNYNL